MEQMYLVEIFIDKVTIFASEEDEKSGANKNLIIKIKFGPKVEFIIKEGQLAVNDEAKDDIIECDDEGRRKWTRTIRVGKSYLFPSYPDTVLMTLSKFPLEIEVWNDDENEVEIFVGIGTMHWETEFFHMLKETAEACKLHDPLSIKQVTPLFAECCCKRVGEIAFILRLSALGESIITEFQQLMNDPDSFVFRTNKAPSMFQCKRIEGDDPNFCMVGSLYETTTLEDPDIVNKAQQKIEVCTELQSCSVGQKDQEFKCKHGTDEDEKRKKKTYPINKIRMGDITGPCGNANCALAHKVRTYIRNLDTYKQKAQGVVSGTKDESSRKVCGTCVCKDDRWHREECPEKLQQEGKQGKAVCSGCGGIAQAGTTCEDRKKNMYGTGATPKGSPTQINFVFSVTEVPNFKKSMYGKDFIVENLQTNYTNYNVQRTPNALPSNIKVGCCRPNEGRTLEQAGCCSSLANDFIAESLEPNYVNRPLNVPCSNISGCCCSSRRGGQLQAKTCSSSPMIPSCGNKPSPSTGKNVVVYNVEESKPSNRKIAVFNVCTETPDEKECKCSPPKPTPPCKTFDCECIAEKSNIAARKTHKPYCPSYKHKKNCPVTMMHEEEEKKKQEDDEDEAEPLPYGLPPIQLGPCPVMGRPCSVPDGFARMYKTAALPPQPPSYSDAGKVCCSKEYERIKKAIKDYMKNEKDNDFRCINKFNVDTERRCCDKEQTLLSLTGKACCGSHKLAIQEKFKEDK